MSEIDYTVVLADLEERRAKLDEAISAIRQIIGAETESGSVSVPNALAATPGQAQTPSSHAFFGLPIGDAVTKYLKMVKQPTKAAAIARALRAGGLLNQSPNFAATVATTLRRDANMTQLPDKSWGLAEWFGPKVKQAPAATAAHLVDAGGGASDPIGPPPPAEQSPDDAA